MNDLVENFSKRLVLYQKRTSPERFSHMIFDICVFALLKCLSRIYFEGFHFQVIASKWLGYKHIPILPYLFSTLSFEWHASLVLVRLRNGRSFLANGTKRLIFLLLHISIQNGSMQYDTIVNSKLPPFSVVTKGSHFSMPLVLFLERRMCVCVPQMNILLKWCWHLTHKY